MTIEGKSLYVQLRSINCFLIEERNKILGGWFWFSSCNRARIDKIDKMLDILDKIWYEENVKPLNLNGLREDLN